MKERILSDKPEKKSKKPETVSVGNVSVKIYSRAKNGYTVWEVSDYSTGARRLRSFSDHDEATREAERIAKLTAKGEVTALDMRPQERATYGRAMELIKETGLPLELVASKYAEAFKILGGDRIMDAAKFFKERNPDSLPHKPVAEAVAELIALKENKKAGTKGASERYIGDLRNRLARFAEAFHVPVDSVTTADVQKWLDGLKVEPQTALNFRRVVFTLFSFCEARGYILKNSNPVEGTEKPEPNADAVAIFSPEEMAKLLAAADADFVPCLAICGFAGLRSAELERLSWRDIDLAAGFITVSAGNAKTRSRRTIPISNNLAQWLAPYANHVGKVWNKKPGILYNAQRETAAPAGVTWKSNGLRHSFCSYRMAQTQKAALVAMEAGNSESVIFKHYHELVRPAQAEQWFGIVPKTPVNVITMGKAVNEK
jgi:integrase